MLSPLIPRFDVFGKTNCLSVPEPEYTERNLILFKIILFQKLDTNVKMAFPSAPPGKA